MRWEDERYVRLYTRDTPEEVALEWEARALWREMLRKFDRAGILELGKAGVRGLAGLTRMPLEVVERSLPELLEDGRVRLVGTALVCPNYIAANETPSSSTLRSREWRARSREVDAAAALGAISDTAQRNVPAGDEASPKGTRGDAEGRTGTPCRAVPCRADPDPPVVPPVGDRGQAEPLGVGEGKPGRAKGDRRKPEVAMPDGWRPDAGVYALGAELGFNTAEVDEEMALFRDRNIGDIARDWQGRARNWMRTARKIRDRRGGTRAPARGTQAPAGPGEHHWTMPEEMS